ncbi:DUF3794 domain-containing protein [Halanaerobacter jeridensis]|uniref:SipL SPOCS domain-containing protein n=1 Tax=Halanaerobacter jeridensis TaxID=706427 RepID=A0A938XS08_9FIRM|nr:DUF3794 domain-containing protein [Halanaerobacter jeridensis]MBM7556621.1 hypothetical protein [Halanaerobacter jeridensis]
MDCRQSSCPGPPDASKQITIDHPLVIPEEKPPQECILDYFVEFKFTKTKVISTNVTVGDPPQQLQKVIVMGKAQIFVKYVGDTEEGDQPVHAAHFNVPFDALIEWPGGPPAGTPVCVCATAEHFQIDPLDERHLFKVLVVKLDVFKK